MPKELRRHSSISRIKQVCDRTGLCRSFIYKLMSENSFPKAFSLGGGRAVGWHDDEIDLWLQQQMTDNRRSYESGGVYTTINSESNQVGNPISNQCLTALNQLADTRRKYRYLVSPDFSDALDNAMDCLQIAVDIAGKEIADDD